jgi:lysozyme
MNLIGESFEDYVNTQIKVRQNKLGAATRDNNNLVWQNSKTGFIRATSCVDVVDPTNSNLTRYPWLQNADLKDEKLAKQFVLDSGLTNTNTTPNSIYQGVKDNRSTINNFAYGLGEPEFGLAPIPGVVSLQVKHLNEGSVREATVVLKAHNRTQFEILDLLYLRLGYSVLIEWGNSTYFDNSEELINFNTSLQNYIFQKGHNHFDVHRKILEMRKHHSANYDAMIGRVKNYQWTLSKSGGYDVILNLISYGDLIDSLKVNNMYGNQLQTNASGEKEISIIEKYKSKHAIGTLFYNIKRNNATVEGSVSIANQTAIPLYLQNPNLKLPFKPEANIAHCCLVKFDEGPDIQYYFRLGTFLKFLQYNSQIFNSNLGTFKGEDADYPAAPYFDFDYDTATNFFYQDPFQFAADPRICIAQKIDPTFDTDYQFNLYPGIQPIFGSAVQGFPNIGLLMNVYLNFEFLLIKLDELQDTNGKVSQTDYLKAICGGINESFGYYNKLEPFIDVDNNIVRIIERRTLPNYSKLIEKVTGKKVSNYPIRLLGVESNIEGSFVRDFNFQSQMDNSFSTTIAIGAQAAGVTVSEDSTALSRLNAGLEDRIFPKKLSSDNLTPKNLNSQTQVINSLNAFANTLNSNPLSPINVNPAGPVPIGPQPQSPIEQQIDALNAKYSNYIADYVTNVNQTYNPQTSTLYSWNPDVYDTQKNLIKNLVQYNNAYNAITNVNPQISPTINNLPINLNLTLDGISGMKILQQFEVNSAFLPAGYGENLIYLIKNITHRVQDNTWLTELETIFVPKIVQASQPSTSNITPKAIPLTPQLVNLNNLETFNSDKIYVGDISFSSNAIALIKRFEGFRPKAYQDTKGIWTIGYGTTRLPTGFGDTRAVRKGDTITQENALIRARLSLTGIQSEIKNNFLPKNTGGKRITFTQNEWDVLMSFSYNLGPGWSSIKKDSGLRKAIISNDYQKVANKLLEYNKEGNRVSPGLVNRRNAERTLFLKK